MRTIRLMIVVLCFLFLAASSLFAQSGQSEAARKYDEFIEYNCEDMMARLDNYAMALQLEPNLQAYIVSYGGSHGQLEARVWAVAAQKYLVSNRGIESKRVVTLYGGNRKLRAIELWLLQSSYKPSTATYAVQPKGVRFKRSKIKYRPCSLFYNH